MPASLGSELAVPGSGAGAPPLSCLPARSKCPSLGSPWEQVPACPARAAISNPGGSQLQLGPRRPGLRAAVLGTCYVCPTLPALHVPVPGEPERPGPYPRVAAGLENRSLNPSAVVTAFRMSDRRRVQRGSVSCPKSYSFHCLRTIKPESNWCWGLIRRVAPKEMVVGS